MYAFVLSRRRIANGCPLTRDCVAEGRSIFPRIAANSEVLMLDDIKNYFANFDGATDSCRTIVLWVTIAMLIAFIATRVYVVAAGKKSGDEVAAAALRMLNGGWITAAITVAIAVIVAFAACYFTDVANGNDDLFPILFYPLSVLALCIVGSAIALFIKPVKITKIVCGSVCGAALIAVLVCMIVYYASGDAGEAFSNIGLYISAVAVTTATVVFAFLADKDSSPVDTKTVTYAAVCVALSFALSYVRLFKMPMGGSITFASMLPLMLFAYMFGCRKGVLVGLIYGILQAVQDPWIVHPAQFVLDYAVAFASIGLTGCMRNLGVFKGNMRAQFALGAIVACSFRLVSHYFAGVFAFGMYGAGYAADYGIPALANEYFYSFVYQCLYLLPELAIVLVAGTLVLSSSSFRRQIELRIANNNRTVRQPVAPEAPAAEAPAQEAVTDDTVLERTVEQND